jgi:hypothetical protein
LGLRSNFYIFVLVLLVFESFERALTNFTDILSKSELAGDNSFSNVGRQGLMKYVHKSLYLLSRV